MAWKESMPETITMRPGRPRMRGTAPCTAAMKESTVMAKVRRTLCSFCSARGRKEVAAALATRMSTRPKVSPMRSNTAGTCAGSASSSGTARALTSSRSSSRTTPAATSAPRRKVMTQWAPSRAKRSAMPRPMPRAPPVITATRPSKDLLMIELSAEEIEAEGFPHGGGQAQALRVHALVVAVEHEWVFGVRDAAGVQPEAVGGHVLPAEVARVGGASGEPRDDLAPRHEGLRHSPERLHERRVHGGAGAFLPAGRLDLHPRGEIADRLLEHGVDVERAHPGQRAHVHVHGDAIRDHVDLGAAVHDVRRERGVR